MAVEDTDAETRKATEKEAGIPLLPRHRETICILVGLMLGGSLCYTLHLMNRDRDAFNQFKRPIYYYDLAVNMLIFLVELYSLSYYYRKAVFCFPDTCVPKCVFADWIKLIWYILLASPNYIFCRRSIYGKLITIQIGGVGIVYFINMIIVSVYINPKLRELEEKSDDVGKAAKETEEED